jgi:hypothetical protein
MMGVFSRFALIADGDARAPIDGTNETETGAQKPAEKTAELL